MAASPEASTEGDALLAGFVAHLAEAAQMLPQQSSE
jgi:hypothetical protein